MSIRQLKITKSITNRENESLEKYLHEISKVQLISSDEETNLSKLIKKGEQSALDKLIKSNLRFVVSVAKQYQNQGLMLSDLINEGNMGLIKAAKKYDHSRGFKFISYAVWWIRQSILQALGEQSRMVRLPTNKLGISNRINKAIALFEQDYERQPSTEEIAYVLDLDSKEVLSCINSSIRHISLDQAFVEGEENSIVDILENPNSECTDMYQTFNISLNSEIQRTLNSLSIREKDIISNFFGIGVDHSLSLEDIGEKYSLTRERVRQIKDKAINRLRSKSRSNILRSYLGA
jgi:RNA polymerase primary sigma factor